MRAKKRIVIALLFSGAPIIILSIVMDLEILAFIGLTFMFWGFLLSFIVPDKFLRIEVMDTILKSFSLSISHIVADFNLEGTPIYVPFPKKYSLPYDIGIRSEFVYIPDKNDDLEATMEQAFAINPNGMRLIPVGLELANLIEKKSKVDFYNASLNSLSKVLPLVITKDLEIADEFIIRIEENLVHTEFRKPVLTSFRSIDQYGSSKTHYLPEEYPDLGCPFRSSIACILTRIAGRPVVIERSAVDTDAIETTFKIM